MPPDFRSDPMQSPEGAGRARTRRGRRTPRRSTSTSHRVSRRLVSLAKKTSVPVVFDLLGFWLNWHMEGGFEGLQRWA